MCGIVGFWDKNAGYDANATVKAMADKIIHRGPDSEGYFVEGPAALGFRRLSIIDLEGGTQPIFNEDKSVVITFNGEIYNFQALRAELEAKGHVFSTKTDTEVVLHGYEEWGEELPGKLRGMFAFVIYDRKAQKLFGARDIFGIKPFYYYEKGGAFLYGSEIKSFYPHPKFQPVFAEKWLPTYLCFEYIPNEETLFEGVKKLPAGYLFTLDENGFVSKPYFEIKYHIDDTKTMEEWENLIEETFRGSCRAHRIADVEVGCFLSSGVDSSYVTRLLRDDMPVRAFSIGYAEEQYSELSHAAELAEKIGVECITRTITARDFFDAVPKVQYHMDEPLPNPSAVPLYYLTQMASQYVTVVLSGEGADELFGGYITYHTTKPFRAYCKTPLALRKAVAKAVSGLPKFHGQGFLTKAAKGVDEYFVGQAFIFGNEEAERVLTPAYRSELTWHDVTEPYFEAIEGADDLTKMQYLDLHLWQPLDILRKADRMTMAHSLELRVPYLDREVWAVARAIPSSQKMRGKTMTKYPLRMAAVPLLPDDWVKRDKKGFPVPFIAWLREEKYYNWAKDLISQDYVAEFFDQKYLLELLDAHYSGRAKTHRKLYTVLSFLIWYQVYFPEKCGVSPFIPGK